MKIDVPYYLIGGADGSSATLYILYVRRANSLYRLLFLFLIDTVGDFIV